ncbi:MAG: type II toxin-antitoxin system Phd/YefM family antitoxin [Gammaproteobacteria bacterium]
MTAFDAKTRFGELLDRVANGEEIVITRHDKPVARMVPEGRRSLEEVRQAVAGLRELQQRIATRSTGKAKLTWDDFKSFVQEGRR